MELLTRIWPLRFGLASWRFGTLLRTLVMSGVAFLASLTASVVLWRARGERPRIKGRDEGFLVRAGGVARETSA